MPITSRWPLPPCLVYPSSMLHSSSRCLSCVKKWLQEPANSRHRFTVLAGQQAGLPCGRSRACLRALSSAAQTPNSNGTSARCTQTSESPVAHRMSSWRVDPRCRWPRVASDLYRVDGVLPPMITRSDQLLVRVNAASLNPIDALMLGGYGRQAFQTVRGYLPLVTAIPGLLSFASVGATLAHSFGETKASKNPLVPGRDAAGEVVVAGPFAMQCNDSSRRWQAGERVALALWPFLDGCLTDYVVCPAGYAAPIPESVTDAEAAALAYCGLTAWAALFDCAGLKSTRDRETGCRVLVAGASGGVGLVALQLADMCGAHVTATVPGDELAKQLVKNAGADEIVVLPDVPAVTSRYDIIIDCTRGQSRAAGCVVDADATTTVSSSAHSSSSLPLTRGSGRDTTTPQQTYQFVSYLSSSRKARYVDMNPPLLNSIDQHGLPGGLVASGFSAGCQVLGRGGQQGRLATALRWAFFRPSGARLARLLAMAADGRLAVPLEARSVPEGGRPFAEVPSAMAELSGGGVRGKIVIRLV